MALDKAERSADFAETDAFVSPASESCSVAK